MSWFKAYAVAIASMLAGGAVVHNIYQPDLSIPLESSEAKHSEQSPEPQAVPPKS